MIKSCYNISMQEIRTKIANLIRSVEPLDQKEQEHINDALAWIESGVEIFRIEKPATPLKHLVSYSVLVDSVEKKILLLDHRKALLMLPSGGHINKNELPLDAAKRELIEELSIQSQSLFPETESPLFVTTMETVGNTPGHIDVSLWYVFEGNSSLPINNETEEFKKEFSGFHWLSFEDILAMPLETINPDMHRFVQKLQKQFE